MGSIKIGTTIRTQPPAVRSAEQIVGRSDEDFGAEQRPQVKHPIVMQAEFCRSRGRICE